MDILPAQIIADLAGNKPLNILDVREPVEYHTFNIGGTNIPLGKLPEAMASLNFDKADELIVVCQRGLRSQTACNMLAEAGYTRVRNLRGGLLACRKLLHS